MRACVRVCVCVWERERERGLRERLREREREHTDTSKSSKARLKCCYALRSYVRTIVSQDNYTPWIMTSLLQKWRWIPRRRRVAANAAGNVSFLNRSQCNPLTLRNASSFSMYNCIYYTRWPLECIVGERYKNSNSTQSVTLVGKNDVSLTRNVLKGGGAIAGGKWRPGGTGRTEGRWGGGRWDEA